MKKAFILTVLILFGASCSLFAGGIDFQAGGGYNGFFMNDEDKKLDSYPIGFTAFGGVGYKFFPTLSVGAEYEFSMDWALNGIGSDQTLSYMEQMPKVYAKFNALNILAVSALAGVDIQTPRIDGDYDSTKTAFTAGARAALLFGYVQYMAVFNSDRVDSRVSAGIILNK